MRKPDPKRTTILCPAPIPTVARLLAGIRDYARSRPGWHLISSPPAVFRSHGAALDLQFVRSWRGDGILTSSINPEELRLIRKAGIPAVNLAGHLPENLGVPRVLVNDYQVGRMAAEHLLGLGLTSLAFLGQREPWFARQRLLGFRERAAEAGLDCEVLLQRIDGRTRQGWLKRVDEMAAWASSLPRPTGVFAVHDYRARLLLEACYLSGIKVPEELAVVGVDNDESICLHTAPTISSVSCNLEKVGWEAASLLDRLMGGARVPKHDTFIEPERVVARQSTDRLFCDDPVAQRAMDFMQGHLGESFNMERLAEAIGVSKRTLETRFRGALKKTPHEFLNGLRVARAKALMRNAPERPLERIAEECGFGSTSAFYDVFRRHTGESPGGFRKGGRRAAQTPAAEVFGGG